MRAAAVPRAVPGVLLVRALDGVRGWHLFAFDVLAAIASAYLAIALRFDRINALDAFLAYMPAVLVPLAIRPFVNDRLGLYRRSWKFASVPDLATVVAASAIGSAAIAAAIYGLIVPFSVAGLEGFPRSFIVVEGLVNLLFVGGVRFAIRAGFDVGRLSSVAPAEGVPTLLYGAGDTGITLLRSARREPRAGVHPVGFLDDDRTRWGTFLGGLRVFGDVAALRTAVAATGASRLLITMPTASGAAVRRVVDAAIAAGLDVKTIPGVHELLDGSVDAFRIRRVRVEDLLRRPVVSDASPEIARLVRGKVALVTGGGGSIGSELARQLFDFAPARLIVVDRAETALYDIQRELEQRPLGAAVRSGGTRPTVEIRLANVADRAAMHRLVGQARPDIMFHAAAYKHVPLMEDHVASAVEVNIGGTVACVEAALEHGVPRFVLVSTDKAVEPTSVMGATKRVAEMIVDEAGRRGGLPYVSVRFGNVLGSAGSVIPLFQRQLEDGKPLTVTHPEMTRYFMTIPEAVSLILEAAAIGQAGDIFVLDMGQPVRILDLARDLVRLTGRDPESVPIEFTGIRPGEKLHERLYYDAEHVSPTPHEKVFRLNASCGEYDLRDQLEELLGLADGDHDEVLRARLFNLTRTRAGAA